MSMSPGDEPQETLSLADALAASRDSEGSTEQTPEVAAAPEVAAPAIPVAPAWEAPAWTNRWKPEARDALGRFASHPELKAHYDPIKSQIEEMYGYTTKRDQEFAAYRQRLDPLNQVLQPYEQRYALQGIPLHQGVQQLMQYADLLSTNPDQAYDLLAGSYKPNDAQAAINLLARKWGVDVGALSQEQSYVDPSIQALIGPLQQRVESLQQTLTQQQAGQQHQQQQALVTEISDFEVAKDENGQSKHPHFAAVFEDMVRLVQMGHAKDVPTAYRLACQYNPQVQETQRAELAEKARQKAIADAARSTAATEKSESASRNVQGKARGNSNQRMGVSLREGFDQAEQTLGYAGT